MLYNVALLGQSQKSQRSHEISMTRNGGDVRLTPRESQIVGLVSQGKSNKQIARELGCKDNTVKVHLHQIFAKFGFTNRTMLATAFLTTLTGERAVEI
jgi:DNA-binding NarL/FixJ family response regulator